MHPNIAFNGTPSGWELLVQWGFLTAAPSHGELLPSSAGIKLRNHSLIYLLFFFSFHDNRSPHRAGWMLQNSHKSCKHFASSVSSSLSFFSAFLYNKHSQMDFFFLNLQGKMTNFACRLRTHASFQLEWISTTFLNPQTRTCPFPQ